MERSKRRRKGGQAINAPGKGSKRRKSDWISCTPEARHNQAFEAYYKMQGIVPDAEWDTFLASMASDLPTTWRLSPHREVAAKQRAVLAEFSSQLAQVDGGALSLPEVLDWFPDARLWQIDVGKPELKKISAYREFRKWLIEQTVDGTLTRQEAVSMIPVAFLNVAPGHAVLDMCAAPGSKTSQIVEHLGWEFGAGGFVLANDVSRKRGSSLAFQVMRLRSIKFALSVHRAQFLPTLYTRSRARHIFDRVLADVPCSGDATMRKNMSQWLSWSPKFALGLHPEQVHIAQRGLDLLDPCSGLMVYSTCSLNPIENEAVIAQLLRNAGPGVIEVVDTSADVPGLLRSPGLTAWSVTDHDGEVLAAPIPGRFSASLFPPSQDEAWIADQLVHCMRILPHAQNTGGFFVTVLRYAATTPAAPAPASSSAAPAPASSSASAAATTSAADAVRLDLLPGIVAVDGIAHVPSSTFAESEDTIVAIDSGCEVLVKLREFLGIPESPASPLHFAAARVGPTRGNKFKLTLVPPRLHDLLSNVHNIKVLNTAVAGTACMTHVDVPGLDPMCSWRIAHECVDVLAQFMTRQILSLPADLFASAMDNATKPQGSPLLPASVLTPETGPNVVDGPGIIAVTSVVPPDHPAHHAPIHLAMWVSNTRVYLHVSKTVIPRVLDRINAHLADARSPSQPTG